MPNLYAPTFTPGAATDPLAHWIGQPPGYVGSIDWSLTAINNRVTPDVGVYGIDYEIPVFPAVTKRKYVFQSGSPYGFYQSPNSPSFTQFGGWGIGDFLKRGSSPTVGVGYPAGTPFFTRYIRSPFTFGLPVIELDGVQCVYLTAAGVYTVFDLETPVAGDSPSALPTGSKQVDVVFNGTVIWSLSGPIVFDVVNHSSETTTNVFGTFSLTTVAFIGHMLAALPGDQWPLTTDPLTALQFDFGANVLPWSNWSTPPPRTPIVGIIPYTGEIPNVQPLDLSNGLPLVDLNGLPVYRPDPVLEVSSEGFYSADYTTATWIEAGGDGGPPVPIPYTRWAARMLLINPPDIMMYELGY